MSIHTINIVKTFCIIVSIFYCVNIFNLRSVPALLISCVIANMILFLFFIITKDSKFRTNINLIFASLITKLSIDFFLFLNLYYFFDGLPIVGLLGFIILTAIQLTHQEGMTRKIIADAEIFIKKNTSCK